MENNNDMPSRTEKIQDIERKVRRANINILAIVGFVTIVSMLSVELDDAIDKNPTEQEWNDPKFQECLTDKQHLFELVVSDKAARMEAEDVCLDEVFPKNK